MRTIIKKNHVYKFNTAPENVKEKIREYFSNDFDLYEPYMVERIKTLKALTSLLSGRLDYSISCVPDRGEFIKIDPIEENLDFDDIKDAIENLENCPLTGVCYDADILESIKENGLNPESLQDALNTYLESIHNEYYSMLEDEYLQDLCEANDYEFTENGKLF